VTARPITRRTAAPRRIATRCPLGVLAALGALAALALPAAAAAADTVARSFRICGVTFVPCVLVQFLNLNFTSQSSRRAMESARSCSYHHSMQIGA
jgi:hypothetical protein